MILKITWKMQTIFKKRKLIKRLYSSLKDILKMRMAYFICMHFISAWTLRFLCRLLHLNSYAFKLLFDNVLYLFFPHLYQYKIKVLPNQSFQFYCINHFSFLLLEIPVHYLFTSEIKLPPIYIELHCRERRRC